jgi:hypothetical protein
VRAAGDREPHVAGHVAAHPGRDHSLKVDLFLCFSRP